MKLGSVLLFAFLFTLLLFTYGVDGKKNKDTKERDRRRKERRDKRREKERQIDNNPDIGPGFPVPTTNSVDRTEAPFGDPVLEATKRPHRHHHKSRGKDKREKAKKHIKDRERRREKGTGEVMEPEIVSFDDMIALREDDRTEPAPAPAPTSKEDKMTEEIPADNDIVDNTTNVEPTTTAEDTNYLQVDLSTTEQMTEEPTPSPTPQVETESSRRRDRGREGKKDNKKKDKGKNKDKNKDKNKEQLPEDLQEYEVEPTEFEFSPTMQPEPQTTIVVESSRREDRRKDREGRRKEKKDKKKNEESEAPENPEELVNDVVPTPDSQTQTENPESRKKGHSKRDKDKRNRERQSNVERRPEVETIAEKKGEDKPNRESDGTRRDSNQKKDKKTDRLREPLDVSSSATLDECKSDRDCSQGSCCEVHERSKICRDYNHQEGQKCRDHCACHSGLICQAPEPTRRSQRNKRLGPSRCRIPGINGMGNDFVGIVQDALEDVMDNMRDSDRNN
ncbi:uncharacterized protein [Amphiura filiformis]|uniref:uncharacterized protein n=1 Tax=Amphiura filiformis TaxID=82378 RepID=UPI003B228EA2